MRSIVLFAYLSLVLFGCKKEEPQNQPSTTSVQKLCFDVGVAFNKVAKKVIQQKDGKYLISGSFDSFNGNVANKILRLNADGTIDKSFNTGTGFDGNIETIAIQNDGKLLVGGTFQSFNNIIRKRILRLNSDGTLDNSFVIGSGVEGGNYTTVSSIAIQSDGKIIAGGWFTQFNGNPSNYLVRINQNGDFDKSFNIGKGFTYYVSNVTIDNYGKILVGGGFTGFNGFGGTPGAPIIKLLRLNADGTLDNTFSAYDLFNGPTTDIKVQSDNKIIVGATLNLNSLVRLNPNGTVDKTFNLGSGFNKEVNQIEIQKDGKYLVGGAFEIFNGISKSYLIRLNTNGSIDSSFDLGAGFNNSVLDILLLEDDSSIIVGEFTSINSENKNRIVKLNSSGSICK